MSPLWAAISKRLTFSDNNNNKRKNKRKSHVTPMKEQRTAQDRTVDESSSSSSVVVAESTSSSILCQDGTTRLSYTEQMELLESVMLMSDSSGLNCTTTVGEFSESVLKLVSEALKLQWSSIHIRCFEEDESTKIYKRRNEGCDDIEGFENYKIEGKEQVYISDVNKSKHPLLKHIQHGSYNSIVLFPILFEGAIVNDCFFCAASASEDGFEGVQELFKTLVKVFECSLSRLIVQSRLINLSLDFEDSQEVLSALRSADDSLSAGKTLLKTCSLRLGAQGSSLYLIDNEKKCLKKTIEVGAEVGSSSIPLGKGIIGVAAMKETPSKLSDVHAISMSQEAFNNEGISPETRSFMCVPLIFWGEIRGVIVTTNKKKENEILDFTEKDLKYLKMVGSCMVSLVRIHEKDDEAQREKKLAKSIYNVMNYMKKIKQNQNNPGEVMKLLTEVADQILSVDRVTFFAVDDARHELVCLASKKGSVEGLRLPIGEGVAGTCASNGEIVNINDAYSSDLFNKEVDSKTGYRTRNILTMPIKDHFDNVIAVVQLLNKESGDFDKLDEEIMTIFNEEVAPAMKQVIMEWNEFNGAVFRRNSALATLTVPNLGDHSPDSEKAETRRSSLYRASIRRVTNDVDNKSVQKLHAYSEKSEVPCIDEIQTWEFDVMKYSKSTLISVAEEMFDHYDLLSHFDIDHRIMSNFIQDTMVSYRDNPFHNFHHAISVLHRVFMLLTVGGADEFLEINDVFACLFAALVHDVDHTGRSNDYEIKERSSLALKYNDQSILENHAVASAFKLARKDDRNIFKNFSDEDFTYTRKMIIKIVLDTDMARHLEIMKKLVALSESAPKTDVGLLEAFDIGDKNSRELLACMIVHASDLVNPALEDFEVAKKWCFRVCEEFTAQAAKEEECGFPVTAFMQGLDSEYEIAKLQVGFINYVILPLWKVVAVLLPKTAHIEANCQRNVKHWEELVEKGAGDGGSG